MSWGERIWDIVGKVGVERLLSSPDHVRRLTIAKAQGEVAGRLLHAKADADVEAVRAGALDITDDGTPRRLEAAFRQQLQRRIDDLGPERAAAGLAESINDSARRLDNAEAAVHEAEDILKNVQPAFTSQVGPSPKEPPPPTDDWLYRWRDSAGEFADEKMRQLWGRVLAGELQTPGKFSLRTLDFLRSISQREASLIARFAPFAANPDFIFKAEERVFEAAGLPFADRLELQDLGLISGVDGLGLTWGSATPEPGALTILAFTGPVSVLVVKAQSETPTPMQFPIYKPTRLGQEVLSLQPASVNQDYLKGIAAHVRSSGHTVWTAVAIPLPDGRHNLLHLQPFPID